MKTSPLSIEEAAKQIGTDLIVNGRATQALHETVVAYQANRRAGTHSVKTKGTVQKSGKKPWRQKGTGRARAGYAASPIWRGGGVVFGPHPRDYSKIIPRQVKKLALKKAFSTRVKAGDVLLADSLDISAAKTKELVSALKPVMERGAVLLVLPELKKNVYLASRNHPDIAVTTGDMVNAEDLLRYDTIVLFDGSLKKLSNRLKD